MASVLTNFVSGSNGRYERHVAKKAYIVTVTCYSLEQGKVGEEMAPKLEYRHRTLKAAKRRLGSLISGKLRQHARELGRREHGPLPLNAADIVKQPGNGCGHRYFIVTPSGERLTWMDARNIVEGGF